MDYSMLISLALTVAFLALFFSVGKAVLDEVVAYKRPHSRFASAKLYLAKVTCRYMVGGVVIVLPAEYLLIKTCRPDSPHVKLLIENRIFDVHRASSKVGSSLLPLADNDIVLEPVIEALYA